MKCAKCGHGRHQHRRAARLSGWQRGRGRTGPHPDAWLPCQFTFPHPNGPIHRPIKCKCRNFKEEVTRG